MIRSAAALAFSACAALPLAAQDDPMEAQRCIWRCLADAQGADDPAYPICVEQRCNAPVAEAPMAAPVAPAPVWPAPIRQAPIWQAGITADGAGRFAGTTDPATGYSLHYLCGGGGQSFLMLTGSTGPSATLTVRVDQAAFALFFTAQGAGHYTPAPRDAPVLAALRTGAQAAVFDAAGASLGSYGLSGAGPAIQAAVTSCG